MEVKMELCFYLEICLYDNSCSLWQCLSGVNLKVICMEVCIELKLWKK